MAKAEKKQWVCRVRKRAGSDDEGNGRWQPGVLLWMNGDGSLEVVLARTGARRSLGVGEGGLWACEIPGTNESGTRSWRQVERWIAKEKMA